MNLEIDMIKIDDIDLLVTEFTFHIRKIDSVRGGHVEHYLDGFNSYHIVKRSVTATLHKCIGVKYMLLNNRCKRQHEPKLTESVFYYTNKYKKYE